MLCFYAFYIRFLYWLGHSILMGPSCRVIQTSGNCLESLYACRCMAAFFSISPNPTEAECVLDCCCLVAGWGLYDQFGLK